MHHDETGGGLDNVLSQNGNTAPCENICRTKGKNVQLRRPRDVTRQMRPYVICRDQGHKYSIEKSTCTAQ
eukprot:5906417-Pyramimonas_sp.AAC.1